MFNLRTVFLLISLLLIMLLVYDRGNINKELKVDVSKIVQEKSPRLSIDQYKMLKADY